MSGTGRARAARGAFRALCSSERFHGSRRVHQAVGSPVGAGGGRYQLRTLDFLSNVLWSGRDLGIGLVTRRGRTFRSLAGTRSSGLEA